MSDTEKLPRGCPIEGNDWIFGMANWFYIAGSLCFLIGTAINMMK